ncbi:MAG: dolichyl-phosphate beta-glucosyltransferase [Bdellovibrionota bacterium]
MTADQILASDVSIVIPAYNEQDRVGSTLIRLRQFLALKVRDYELLVVDDGSTDATTKTVEEKIGDWPEARLIKLDVNQGKGAAIRKGVLEAQKKNLCFMDADCSTDLEMLGRLYQHLSDQTPLVIGSRDLKGAEIVVKQFWLREYAAKLFNLWIQFWLLPGVWDTQCGFKLFRTDLAKRLFRPLMEKRFGFDIEILYRAKRLKVPIVEVPVRWSNVLNSRVNPVRDGLSMAWQVVKLRLKSPL